MELKYFFDSCAVIEIVHGTPSYEKYDQGVMTTSLLNTIEVYWVLLNNYGAAVAKTPY